MRNVVKAPCLPFNFPVPSREMGASKEGLVWRKNTRYGTWDQAGQRSRLITISVSRSGSRGCRGSGKTTLARLLKQALVVRGYKTEIIDTPTLSKWLNLELHVEEEIRE